MLPIDSLGADYLNDPFEKFILDLLLRGNLAQAEIHVRESIKRNGESAKALNYLGWLAASANLVEFSAQYFRRAAIKAPHWLLPKRNLEIIARHSLIQKELCPFDVDFLPGKTEEKLLLIKAWGYGFWSDVCHVLGQILVAELTNRKPIVHWGSNSLFWNGKSDNAFDEFFEPVSPVKWADIKDQEGGVWPNKWNARNLAAGEISKWKGEGSRLAGFSMLKRNERLIVSDFYTSIYDLMHWIPETNPLYGIPIAGLYANLLKKYLRTKTSVLSRADEFYSHQLAGEDFIAVHARGSDKVREMSELDKVNRNYFHAIDELRLKHKTKRIFLMTDDSKLLNYYIYRYGEDVVFTDCQRTDNSEGIHYKKTGDPAKLGVEVMIDVYTAGRAKVFVGNASSNPSLVIRYLKDWSKESVVMLGSNIHELPNTMLHDW